MFSYINSLNPFAHLPSSSHHPLPPPPPPRPPPSLIGQDANDNFLQHSLPPTLETGTNIAVLNNVITTKQDFDGLNGQHYDPSNFIPSKRPLKKDRHSKIYTAQGLRDRRVRLSIEIAREFFDLQDMLGFDKASKTLEWLLINSREAIKEFAQMKHSCINGGAKSFSSSTSDECEVVSENGDLGDVIVSKSTKSLVDVCREKKMKKKLQKAACFQLNAKESRAKARARARERTIEKMCNRRLHEWKKCPECPDTSPHILNQLRSLNYFQAFEKSSSYGQNLASSLMVVAHDVDEASSHSPADQAAREDVIEESILIKRKLKPSSILGYQQNLVMPKDVICNSNNINNINFLPSLPQNWDTNSSIARSTFCAITNVNLSNGPQIYGQPWEARNN